MSRSLTAFIRHPEDVSRKSFGIRNDFGESGLEDWRYKARHDPLYSGQYRLPNEITSRRIAIFVKNDTQNEVLL
ncbi:unnamed protein product [Larinioides sclopetarius]|uniref:Uncharacterized protein n=1 Tax=Larinioides sclopetarius TaxID=280406 RepID=A0AAV1ZV15_9ARAC